MAAAKKKPQGPSQKSIRVGKTTKKVWTRRSSISMKATAPLRPSLGFTLNFTCRTGDFLRGEPTDQSTSIAHRIASVISRAMDCKSRFPTREWLQVISWSLSTN